MNAAQLSNMQLFHIAQNKNLNMEIRNAAEKEITLRTFSIEETEAINNENKQNYLKSNFESLSAGYKFIAFMTPFFVIIHVILSSRYLAFGKTKKWKQYWNYFCLGLIIWTVITILIGKTFPN